jgi:hypothetical protein
MAENIVLTLFFLLSAGTGWLLFVFFRRVHESGRTASRAADLIAGNFLILIFLISLILLCGECYYRFVCDTTDSFGLNKVSERWLKRHYQFNNAGYRDNRDYDGKCRPGKRRVTFIGDSFSAGHGIKNVDDRFTNLVRAMRPEWEVHTLAENGLETGHELYTIQAQAKSGYDFNAVVLVYNLNDVADLVPEKRRLIGHIRLHVNPGPVFRSSWLLNTLYFRFVTKHDTVVNNYYAFIKNGYEGDLWERQQRRLGRMAETVAAYGGRMAAVTFPFVNLVGQAYPYTMIHQRLDSLWKAAGVPHLDLLAAFSAWPSKKLVINPRDAHPNVFAHRLAAQAIVRFLDSTGMVGKN